MGEESLDPSPTSH